MSDFAKLVALMKENFESTQKFQQTIQNSQLKTSENVEQLSNSFCKVKKEISSIKQQTENNKKDIEKLRSLVGNLFDNEGDSESESENESESDSENENPSLKKPVPSRKNPKSASKIPKSSGQKQKICVKRQTRKQAEKKIQKTDLSKSGILQEFFVEDGIIYKMRLIKKTGEVKYSKAGKNVILC
jgi:hypothetical protein